MLRPYTSMKLSFRVPPTADAPAAAAAVERILTADPPSGAHVAVSELEHGSGWDAPDLAPWLGDALRESSERRWGAPMGTLFEGGSIPFMAMLGQRFPRAQFVITGVLGPGNNAHGPNEFIYLPSAEKITSVIADVLVAHAHSPA